MKRCGMHPICQFEGWDSEDNNRDLVYFAVKKEHDMGYKYNNYQKTLKFDELVTRAIESEESEFEYHNHHYIVQKKDQDSDCDYTVISVHDGEKVADVLVEDEESIVVVDNKKREYIRNTRSAYYENLYRKELESVRKRGYPELQDWMAWK